MNAERSDFDRVLRTWFEDGPTVMSDRVVDGIADRIARQPQRRSWRLPWRLQPMSNTIKLAAGLAAAIVVAVVAWQLMPGREGGVGSPSSPTPTVQPSATPARLTEGTLVGGLYRVQLSFIDPGLAIVADIPAGWIGHPDVPAITSPEGSNEGVLIGFMEADGLFSDPCHWDLDGTGAEGQPGDVEVGPAVGDLVTALKANTSYTSSTPNPVTVGGFEGQELELQLPGDEIIRACDQRPGQSTGDYFVFPEGFYAQGPNSRWHLYIVDVDGTRLITMVSIAEGIAQADIAAAEAIVESFEITP